MRVLIATPAGGGMVNLLWAMSMIDTFYNSARLRAQKHYDIGLYTVGSESLIQRARNHFAQVALTSNWDKLLMIDADVSWTWPQVQAIIESDKAVVAAACPWKTYPLNLNYMPFSDDDQFHPDGLKSPEALKAMAEHYYPNPKTEATKDVAREVSVPFIGTAFMCIKREVLIAMAETATSYMYPNPHSGHLESHWDMFETKPLNNVYLSEDWGFCHKARELGFGVYVNADVIVNHTGAHTFSADSDVSSYIVKDHARKEVALKALLAQDLGF